MRIVSYRKYGLPLISAVLLVLSVWVPALSFLIWFALTPLLLGIQKETSLKSFLIGLGVGGAFFTGFLYWIVNYEFRIFAIVLALTIPLFGFFACFTNWLWRHLKNDLAHIFAPPIAWFSISFLYSLTPIDIIGDQIALLQAPLFPAIVRTTGISGITFLIMLANSLEAHWLTTKSTISKNGIFIVLFLLILGALSPSLPAKVNPIRVALVQHNFPIASDWRFGHQKDVITTYEKTIRDLGPTSDLVIFPQYGLPHDVLREPEWLSGLARLKNTSILLGTYIPKLPGGSLSEGERFDSALLFSPKQAVQQYQAMTPPPFRQIGEVLGTKRTPLLLNGTRIGIMLCYEDVRSEEGKLWVKNGAEVLVALSNPGHFLGTPLPLYHLIHDQIRAIETGRYVIRVSPNGFSAIVDPHGKIIMQSNLEEEEILKGVVYPTHETTLFSKTGLILPALAFWVSLILLFYVYGRDSIKRLARKIR